MTQRTDLIVQPKKLLKPAVADYIDRIVDRRGLRQRVITQPRPNADICPVAEAVVLLAANLINAAHVRRPDISARNRSRESEPPGVAKTMGTWVGQKA